MTIVSNKGFVPIIVGAALAIYALTIGSLTHLAIQHKHRLQPVEAFQPDDSSKTFAKTLGL